MNTVLNRFCLVLLFFFFSPFPSFSEGLSNGQIVSIESEVILSPEDIDNFTKELFEGYELPRAEYAVKVYWIKYKSLYPDNSSAIITAQVFLPQYASAEERSLYVFGPGSTGLRDSCRPSREHILGIRWGLYRSHVLAHAGQGSIGLMPDYMGFGDPERMQYYMVAQSEGRVMLDGIRAVNNLIREEQIPGIGKTFNFVAGFSQGGHAAFAAADLRKSYAPEIPLHGVIGYGPTTNLVDLFREYSDVSPMVLYTYRNLYGEELVDPAQVLPSPYAEALEKDMKRMCVGGMQSYYSRFPRELFRKEFADALIEGRLEQAYPDLYNILEENSSGLSGHGVPSLILQGSNDIVIFPETQEQFAEKLRKSGVEVEYKFYTARHDTRQISFFDTRTWIENHMR